MRNPHEKSNFIIGALKEVAFLPIAICLTASCSGENSLSRDYYISMGARSGADFQEIKNKLSSKGFRCERVSPKGQSLDETCTINRGFVIYGCLRRVTFSIDENRKIISFTGPTEACAGL